MRPLMLSLLLTVLLVSGCVGDPTGEENASPTTDEGLGDGGALATDSVNGSDGAATNRSKAAGTGGETRQTRGEIRERAAELIRDLKGNRRYVQHERRGWRHVRVDPDRGAVVLHNGSQSSELTTPIWNYSELSSPKLRLTTVDIGPATPGSGGDSSTVVVSMSDGSDHGLQVIDERNDRSWQHLSVYRSTGSRENTAALIDAIPAYRSDGDALSERSQELDSMSACERDRDTYLETQYTASGGVDRGFAYPRCVGRVQEAEDPSGDTVVDATWAARLWNGDGVWYVDGDVANQSFVDEQRRLMRDARHGATPIMQRKISYQPVHECRETVSRYRDEVLPFARNGSIAVQGGPDLPDCARLLDPDEDVTFPSIPAQDGGGPEEEESEIEEEPESD